MRRLTLLMFCGLFGCAAGLLALMGGCGSGSGSLALGKIQHVVVIFQENRTPDNLFHGLPGADIANSGVNSHGQTIQLASVSLSVPYDLNHDHPSFVAMYDSGKMDGANLITWSCAVGTQNCPPPNPQFAYVDPTEVAPYMQLAEQYTFGDRMFQTNQGPSFPAHQFIISATSAPSATSTSFVAENPVGVSTASSDTGCTAPPQETVALIDPSGSESTKIYPCFEHQTLTDLLDGKGVSWRYYTPSAGSIWTGPNAINHLRMGKDWSNVILQQTQVLTDIANQHLPQVTWVIPDGLASDHAEANDGSGPSWVASIVNAIGNSSYWSNTAIVITWDDWGGWYDHVPPQVINAYEYGFRVPLIVVSPYAKKGYVSHVTHDFGSILKFIESVYGLGTLGYADVKADDLSDCFNFTQTPLTFQMISAPLAADHFLNSTRPPTDPDDD
jgi:phospholipase C